MHPIFFVCIIFHCYQGVSSAPYVAGDPGGPWSNSELLIVKAKLNFLYHRSGLAPKALRLGFHDCIKYADGTGGCDGCLNWKNVDVKLNPVPHSRNLSDHVETDNNGLGNIVRELENVYTKTNFPWGAPELKTSLRDSGKSRADLWAYAAMVAVEWGITNNNIACDDRTDKRLGWGDGKGSCVHNNTEPGCKITMPRDFIFQTGRKDCTEFTDETYKAAKTEKHPSYLVNGRDTIDFMMQEFNFSSRETVAIFGAHTYGKPHFAVSQVPYTWTSRAIFLFNNDYYKSMTGQKRWYFNEGNCNKVGDAFGNIPDTKWIAHTRMTSKNGGPTFWIKHNHVCPNCAAGTHLSAYDKQCCSDGEAMGLYCRPDPKKGSKEPRQAGEEDKNMRNGCERLRFISGADEVALNCEIGLYLDFEVDNGVLYGCPGLEIFNKTMSDPNTRKTVWSTKANGRSYDQPQCNKQMYSVPSGSTPAYQVMEEYANNQDVWIADFMSTMEKMLSNGYAPHELSFSSGFYDKIVCPFDYGHRPNMYCYENSTAVLPYFTIESRWNELSGLVMTMDETTGKTTMLPRVPGAANQEWATNGNMDLIFNKATNKPFMNNGNVYWKIVPEAEGDLLLNAETEKALDCYSVKTWQCTQWWKHGAPWQRFTLNPIIHQ